MSTFGYALYVGTLPEITVLVHPHLDTHILTHSHIPTHSHKKKFQICLSHIIFQHLAATHSAFFRNNHWWLTSLGESGIVLNNGPGWC